MIKEQISNDDDHVAEDHGACGLSAVVNLDGKADNQTIRMVMEAGRRMEFRSGITEDDEGKIVGADGAGVLFDTKDKGPWMDMMSDRQKRRVHDPKDVQMSVVHFDRSLTELDIAVRIDAINESLHRRGLEVLDWEKLVTNEDGIDERRLPRIPRYYKLTYQVPGVDHTQVDAVKAYRVARRINSKVEGVKLASMAMDRVAFKGVLTGTELMKFFPILNQIGARAAISHVRYSTNVVTDQEQPFGSLAHNGEINSVAATRKALMNMAKAWGFVESVLVKGGSDSAHLNDALELMLVNGVSLPEALIRLIPPALMKVDNPEMRKFIQASHRAMETFGMWEGPAAILGLDNTYFSAHLDRLGLRPARWMEVEKDGPDGGTRFVLSSEVGAVPFEYEKIVRTGNLKGGETIAVRLSDGEVLEGNALYERVMRDTGLNWKELVDKKIFVPSSFAEKKKAASEVKISLKDIKENGPLYSKLAGFGWTESLLKSVIERINQGKGIISSMGVHGPLAILDPNLANINDLFLARAAIITNPPFDPQGEGDAVETDVYLGKSPNVTVSDKAYEPIYPQWHVNSPIVSSKDLTEMKEKSTDAAEDGVDAPKTKRIHINFHGGYKDFLAKIEEVKQQVLQYARANNGDGPSVIVLSDRKAFEGEMASMGIPPILLIQAINTELINNGLERNVSLVVDSGTIRSGHDIGLLIANGASAVTPWMLEEVAQMADNPDQAVTNLYKELNAELVKMMSKPGITTVLGARTGYWFGAVGLAPEVTSLGGGKTVSQVGGMGMKLIFEALVEAQLRRLNDAEKWMKDTSEKADKAEGAYDLLTREFFNLAAIPDAGRLKKLIERVEREGGDVGNEDYSAFLGGEALDEVVLSDIAFQIATKRRLDKKLTLRDCLAVDYRFEEVTPELLATAPSMEQIMSTLRMSHMSLGAHGAVAHASMVRGCNRAGVKSASGEGGEEKSRSRTGSRPEDLSYARQVGTAGWGVDRQFLCEAEEICIKVAQGAKPGEGGDLPGAKVTAFIASIRHVKEGTRLISPPPNHDIYSIEDLKGRIMGLRALNPRAKISIKVASMPGLGTIAVGAAKAGADVFEISGFDGGTGAAGEQSINHCGYPVEIGLAESHQYLVKAGLRKRMKLAADGKMMTAEDFIKMRLTGADEIGLGTLLMIYVQCIACSSCHTNKCPTGITTQDVDLQRKRFVGKEGVGAQALSFQDEFQIEAGAKGVKNGLEALARDIQRGLAKMGITAEQFEKMVGDVERLTQVETGNPVMDSLDLGSVLLASCNEPGWMNARAMAGETHESLANVYRNKAGAKILAEAERFLNGEVDELEISLKIKSTDREIGTGLSGQIYERLARFGKLKGGQVITLNTEGEGGHNYGAYAGNGMVMRHEGFLNDSVGAYMSGNGKIVTKSHPDLKKKSGHVLIGNQACMCATGGTLYCPGRAGARLGERNSGATIVAEGANDYPFEYMTAGEGFMLGDWVGELGSRMTGGRLFVYDPEGTRRDKISKAYIEPEAATEADFDAMKARMTDYYGETGSEVAEKILKNWETEKLNFVKMMPKK